jgi:hypothetical protein
VETAADAERRLVSTTWAVAVTAVAIQTGVHIANFAFWKLDGLDADQEYNAFSWASTMTTFAAAFFLFIPAAAIALDRMTTAVTAVIAFFSIDDAVGIHERLAERSVEVLNVELSLERVIWPLAFLPALVFVFVMLLRMARTSPDRISFAITSGLLLLGAAVFAEITSAAYLADDRVTWTETLEIAFEEGAELAGWILLAGALAARAYLLAGRRR